MTEQKRNLLGEALAIKDYDARIAFIGSLSDEEQAEFRLQLAEAMTQIISAFEELGIQVRNVFAATAQAIAAFGEALRQSKQGH